MRPSGHALLSITSLALSSPRKLLPRPRARASAQSLHHAVGVTLLLSPTARSPRPHPAADPPKAEPPVSYAYGPPPSSSSSYAPSAAPTSTSPRATSLSRYHSQMRGESMAGIVPGGAGADFSSAPPTRSSASYAAYPPAPTRGGPVARPDLVLAPGEDYVPGIGPRKYNLGTSALPLPGDGGATGVGVSATYRTAFSGGWDAGAGAGAGAGAQKYNAENYPPPNFGGGAGGREVGAYVSYEATRDQRRRVDPSYAADLNSQIADRQARRRAEKDAEVMRDRALLSEPSNLPAGVRLSSRPSIRLASAMAPTQALSSNWDATGHGGDRLSDRPTDAWTDPRSFNSAAPAAQSHAPSSPQRVREMPANLDSDAMREAVRA